MNALDLLKGKIVSYTTDAKVEIPLEIKKIKEVLHSRDLEPASSKNDWWPPSESYTLIEVEFTTGFKKEYRTLSEIKFLTEEEIIDKDKIAIDFADWFLNWHKKNDFDYNMGGDKVKKTTKELFQIFKENNPNDLSR